jgi:hypothetical protein
VEIDGTQGLNLSGPTEKDPLHLASLDLGRHTGPPLLPVVVCFEIMQK